MHSKANYFQVSIFFHFLSWLPRSLQQRAPGSPKKPKEAPRKPQGCPQKSREGNWCMKKILWFWKLTFTALWIKYKYKEWTDSHIYFPVWLNWTYDSVTLNKTRQDQLSVVFLNNKRLRYLAIKLCICSYMMV